MPELELELAPGLRLSGDLRLPEGPDGLVVFAHGSLASVASPTLLIVGGADRQVLALNEKAAKLLRCEHEVAIVPGATHLFEEPGALERVSGLAGDWFRRHARP